MNNEYRILIQETGTIKGGTCIPMTIPACFQPDKSNIFLGEILNFKNLKFGKRLNNYGQCSFDIEVDDTVAGALISLRKYTVWIYKVATGGDVLVWSGEQVRRTGKLQPDESDWCTIYCYDWFYLLKDRYTAQLVNYTNVDAGLMAWNLINTSQKTSTSTVVTIRDENIQSISETNIDGQLTLIADYDQYGQSFTGDGGLLSKISLFIARFGEITGDMVVKLYTSTGISGNLIPTGEALATSDTHSISESLNVSGQTELLVSSDGYTKIDFIFDETFTLESGVNYIFVLEPIDASDEFYLGASSVSVATGNSSYLDNGTPQIWQPSTSDISYYINSVVITTETVVEFSYNSKKDFGITQGTIEETYPRDREYSNQNIMEAIMNLSDVLGGFDFEITNDRVFNVYTVKGIDLTDSVILEYERNLKTVTIDEDFTNPCNNAIVLGEITDSTELSRVDRPDATSQIESKLREMVMTADNVVDENTLNSKGDAMLAKYKVPLIKVNFELIRSSLSITSFSLGDLIRLIVKKGIYDYDDDFRIFEWEVSIDEANTEKITLILGELGI